MTSARCLRSSTPILSPKICQGPDSSDAHGHVSPDRRILRQGDIQDTSVGGGQVSPLMVGTRSNFWMICDRRVRASFSSMNSVALSALRASCRVCRVWQSPVRSFPQRIGMVSKKSGAYGCKVGITCMLMVSSPGRIVMMDAYFL